MWTELNDKGGTFSNVIRHAIQIETATQQSKGTQISYIFLTEQTFFSKVFLLEFFIPPQFLELNTHTHTHTNTEKYIINRVEIS